MESSEFKASNQAELSSLSTALEEITERIVRIADSYAGQKLDGYAHDLYQAERSLKSALRSVKKVRNN